MRGWRGCGAGPRDARVNSPIARWVSAAAVAAAAAAPRPPGPPAGRCWRPPQPLAPSRAPAAAAAGARHRGRRGPGPAPIPAPRPPPPPPPRPAGPARPPGCTPGPRLGAGERTGAGEGPPGGARGVRRRGPSAARRGARSRPARRLRPPPHPHRSPLPSAASRAPLAAPRRAGGASGCSLGPPRLRASRVCDQMCVCARPCL